jgi:hypothetical protein
VRTGARRIEQADMDAVKFAQGGVLRRIVLPFAMGDAGGVLRRRAGR